MQRGDLGGAFVRNQGSAVEAALWAALEVLEERAELLRRIAEQRGSSEGMRKQLHDKADEAAERAKLVRRALEGDVALPRPRSSSAAR